MGTRRAKTCSATVLAVSAMVVVSCLCATARSDQPNVETNETNEQPSDCSLWVPEKDALRMPIPFTTNGVHHSIIYPNQKGRLNIGQGRHFKLSCATSSFASTQFPNTTEALVSCAGGNWLRYKGLTYKYEDFRCSATPKSQLIVTGNTCQTQNYTVVAVGFKTKYAFLKLYNICFDKSTKNSVYTWYSARSPYYNQHQSTGKRPAFAQSRELYGNTDVNRKYTIAEQRKTVATILKSDKLADDYIQNDGNHFMSRGHYAAKADFYFGFEQSATFYYANVAPQWQIFNGHVWADLEADTRQRLDDDTASGDDSRHLVVTGTYGSCTLADVDGVQQPLFLDPPSALPVPLFYWKLVYDRRSGDGIVRIGLNNPYREIDDSLYLCPNVCSSAASDANKGLVYCCTKASFEEFYGQLDPIVFKE